MSQLDLPTILLVEDNVDDYDAAVRSFEVAHLDNPLQWCTNGQDALNYLKGEGKYPRATRPGLILLDLNMPGIDGRKTLAFIRQNPILKKIPVVILTTSADDNDIEQCYELGASSYIQKPMGLASMVKISGQLKSYWFDAVLLPKSIGM